MLVLAREHLAAAQMIQRPALGGRHQPRAGLVRHAGHGPVLERRHQRFLGQVLGQRHVAQHARQARDQPRLLDPPDGEDGAMDVGGRHRRRRYRKCRLTRRAGIHVEPRAGSSFPIRRGADLAGAFPARHVIEVQLHELVRHGDRLLLVAQFEDRVAADHFLGFDERAVDHAELAVRDLDLAPPIATGISPPLSIMRPALISRSASLRMASISAGVGPRIGCGGGNDIHEAHRKTPVEASCGDDRRKTVSLSGRRIGRLGSTGHQNISSGPVRPVAPKA